MKTLSERDKKIIWHPLTQEKTADWPIPIVKGKGPYVYDENGKSYLDLISSWWVNIHGHAHPVIAKKIYEQALRLEHIIFAGFTHPPAVELCENLQKVLPPTLKRFFFSDNGSTAVEIALKMAYQYWHNQDQKKRKVFLSFAGGYHGDTFGAMSVGAKSGFHDVFEAFFFEVFSLPFPATWDDDETIEEEEALALQALDRYLEERGEETAAIILEPLIQGASGMRFCRAEFVQAVIKRVRQYGILVIFDEIMTGFGRTGTHFACEQIGMAPDFMCLSKGLTGGFLPLALTVATEQVYEAFLDDSWKKAFAHSHSYTANPIACAAAVASLQLLLTENTQQAIKTISQGHQEGIAQLKKRNGIRQARSLGTISAFEIDPKIVIADFKRACLAQGLIIRPLGQTVYLLPPYCLSQEELRMVYEKIEAVTCNHTFNKENA